MWRLLVIKYMIITYRILNFKAKLGWLKRKDRGMKFKLICLQRVCVSWLFKRDGNCLSNIYCINATSMCYYALPGSKIRKKTHPASEHLIS